MTPFKEQAPSFPNAPSLSCELFRYFGFGTSTCFHYLVYSCTRQRSIFHRRLTFPEGPTRLTGDKGGKRAPAARARAGGYPPQPGGSSPGRVNAPDSIDWLADRPVCLARPGPAFTLRNIWLPRLALPVACLHSQCPAGAGPCFFGCLRVCTCPPPTTSLLSLSCLCLFHPLLSSTLLRSSIGHLSSSSSFVFPWSFPGRPLPRIRARFTRFRLGPPS